MSIFSPYDVVVLPAGISEHGIPPGSRAVILERHDEPYLSYEVEVVDDDGKTLFCGAVDPALLEAEELTAPE